MSDSLVITENMTIYNADGTKAVGVITDDGGIHRLTVDSLIKHRPNNSGLLNGKPNSVLTSILADTETVILQVGVPVNKKYFIHKWDFGGDVAGRARMGIIQGTGLPIFIDDFEDVTDWTATGAGSHVRSLNTDLAFVSEGVGSIKSENLGIAGGGSYALTKAYGSTQDWSAYRLMSIDGFRDDQETEFSIRITDSGGSYDYPFQELPDGVFSTFLFDLELAEAGGIDLSDIQEVRIRMLNPHGHDHDQVNYFDNFFLIPAVIGDLFDTIFIKDDDYGDSKFPAPIPVDGSPGNVAIVIVAKTKTEAGEVASMLNITSEDI